MPAKYVTQSHCQAVATPFLAGVVDLAETLVLASRSFIEAFLADKGFLADFFTLLIVFFEFLLLMTVLR